MKKLKTIQAIFLLSFSLLFLISCSNEDKKRSVGVDTPEEVKQQEEKTADVADVSFTDGMTEKAFQNYLHLKDALVHSDAGEAKKAAGNLAETFTEERAAIKSTAGQIAGTDNLEKQRELFFTLTKQLEMLFKEGISGGTIYKQYCPMAFDNQGASWFSEVKEIRNPFFGDKMLKCGKIEETIEKK